MKKIFFRHNQFLPAANSKNKKLKLALFLVACFIITFSCRYLIRERECDSARQSSGSTFAPFYVESAIMYHYINKVSDGTAINVQDSTMAGLGERTLGEYLPLGLEYYWGNMLKIYRSLHPKIPPEKFERSAAETNFIRNCITAHIALLGVLVGVFLHLSGMPYIWALLATLAYAAAPAAVARYTGQDILYENFAMPFLLAYLCSLRYTELHPRRQLPYVLTGISAFLSVSFWDAPQICIAILAAILGIRAIAGDMRRLVGNQLNFSSDEITAITLRRANGKMLLFTLGGIIVSALLIPYNRAHGLIFSPVIPVIISAVLFLSPELTRRFKYIPTQMLRQMLAVLLVWTIWFLLFEFCSDFAKNYNHFGTLIWAKIKFWNVKPADPALLNFDQRVLWTPSLHSATFQSFKLMFPAAIWLFAGVTLLVLIIKKYRRIVFNFHNNNLIYFLAAWIYFVGYIYLVRLHVFAAIFIAISLPVILYQIFNLSKNQPFPSANSHWQRRFKYLLIILAILVTGLEIVASSTLRRAENPGDMQALRELVGYLRTQNLANKFIAADFANSSFIKGYTDAPIVIQPKFEFADTREIYRQFNTALYHGNEEDLLKFCEKYQVKYLLFTISSLAGPMQIYSERYRADAKQLKSYSPAYKFESRPRELSNFYLMPFPPAHANLVHHYAIYKVITDRDKAKGKFMMNAAADIFMSGNPEEAEKILRSALALDPSSPLIKQMYINLYRRNPPEVGL